MLEVIDVLELNERKAFSPALALALNLALTLALALPCPALPA